MNLPHCDQHLSCSCCARRQQSWTHKAPREREPEIHCNIPMRSRTLECYVVSLAKCTQRKTKKQTRPFVWQGVCEWHPQESLELSPGQENGWGGSPFVEGSGCRKLSPGCGGQCWHHATRKDWHHGNKLSSAFSNLTVSSSGFVVGMMSAPQRKKPKLLTCWNI